MPTCRKVVSALLIVEGSIISDSAVVFSLSRSFSLDVEGVILISIRWMLKFV